MKSCLIYIIILFAFFGNKKLLAQSPAHNIALTSTDQGAIVLKCFSQEVYFDNGINIYRRIETEQQWTKLNAAPIKKGDYVIPQSTIDKDKILKRLIDFANKVPHEKIKGFVKITMLVDAIQNNEYAKFLGILYEDKSVQKGVRYEYKVCKITNTNSEEIVSVSEHEHEPVEDMDIEHEPVEKKRLVTMKKLKSSLKIKKRPNTLLSDVKVNIFISILRSFGHTKTTTH
jgi:hypothetical protein